jgi:hypothetical protein
MTTPYLEYSDADHAYFADGIQLPSVTQILDRAGFISDFAKRDAQACWRGTAVHQICADDDLGNRIDFRKMPLELRNYVRGWRRFRAETGFECYEVERRVDSVKNGYSGRLDRLGALPGQSLAVVLDIKTAKSGSVADYVRYQLAAYAHGYEPGKVFNRVGVALKPDGTYRCKIFPVTDFHIDLNEFLRMTREFKEK